MSKDEHRKACAWEVFLAIIATRHHACEREMGMSHKLALLGSYEMVRAQR